MRILGIDPGSASTGYGVVESRSGRLRALAHGTIVPPRGLPFLDRLPHIASAIEALVRRVAPDGAAVEDVFHARNSRVALQLGHVRGAALLPLLRAGVPIHEYAPRLVKKAVTGSGAAEKEQVRRMVRLLLGLGESALSLDASDALAVAICHAHSIPCHGIREAAARA
jgi:crossover junction endodeoxyribonuclease RuvC